jgi:hypothetical protein
MSRTLPRTFFASLSTQPTFPSSIQDPGHRYLPQTTNSASFDHHIAWRWVISLGIKKMRNLYGRQRSRIIQLPRAKPCPIRERFGPEPPNTLHLFLLFLDSCSDTCPGGSVTAVGS